MSLFDDSNTTLTLNTRRTEEARMRVTLGLTSEAHAHAKRPIEESRQSAGPDSDRPANMVNTRRLFEPPDPLRARLSTLAGELKADRSERVAAQHALADAQRTIQQLHTKLAHAEIAAAEALAVEQQARLEAEAKLRDTPRATPPRAESLAEPKRRGRPPGKRQLVEEAEPQPVKWWLPSYKASRAKPPRSKS